MCLTPSKLLVRRFIANQATNIPAAWTESAIEDEVASTQIRQFEKPLPSLPPTFHLYPMNFTRRIASDLAQAIRECLTARHSSPQQLGSRFPN